MMNTNRSISLAVVLLVSNVCLSDSSLAQIERFKPCGGEDVEVWRITNDPLVRDHANYHNTQCWSPDGRYLCYTHYASQEEVRLYDLRRNEDISVDQGASPRWAARHNWLFYVRSRPQEGPRHAQGTHVMWRDIAAERGQQWGSARKDPHRSSTPTAPAAAAIRPASGPFAPRGGSTPGLR